LQRLDPGPILVPLQHAGANFLGAEIDSCPPPSPGPDSAYTFIGAPCLKIGQLSELDRPKDLQVCCSSTFFLAIATRLVGCFRRRKPQVKRLSSYMHTVDIPWDAKEPRHILTGPLRRWQHASIIADLTLSELDAQLGDTCPTRREYQSLACWKRDLPSYLLALPNADFK
jgi:hypothetical protein